MIISRNLNEIFTETRTRTCDKLLKQSHDFVHACCNKWERGFLWKFLLALLSSEDVHLEFLFWIFLFFFYFTEFLFLLLDLICFQNKKYCLKIMKNFWFKHRNCVFLELKICISYFDLQYLEFCVNFHFVTGGEGGGGSNTCTYYKFNKV